MGQLTWYLSLILFAVSTCGSPGPNNIMVMASGANYGIRRSVPHVIGINIGFPVMVILVGVGLGEFLRRFPVLLDVLRPVGVAYLLYLAYRIMSAPTDSNATTEKTATTRDQNTSDGDAPDRDTRDEDHHDGEVPDGDRPGGGHEGSPREGKPLTVLQAALFQFVNPKAWVVVVGALFAYGTTTGSAVTQTLLIALIFLLFGTPCTVVWLWLGSSLKKVLTTPVLLRGFNVAMAALLVASIVPTLGEVYRSLQ